MKHLTRALAFVGAASLLFASLCFGKLLLALHLRSDLATALLAAPDRNAFAGRVFWITGASSGIGKALALHLCNSHDDVKLVLSSRRQEALEGVAEECKQKGSGVETSVLPLDLADHASLPAKTEEALAMYDGRVDVLVNNGGLTTRAMARNSSFEVHSYVADVDYLSYVALTKALLPHWESGDSGSKPIVINTSSLAGKIGAPVRTAYCGAKFAIHGWFDAFRIEQILVGKPIAVLNVVLGSTRTNVARNAVTHSPQLTFGESDDNIEAGLDPAFVVERVVAAAHAGREEMWIAPPVELGMAYMFQYFPETAKKLLVKTVLKKYAVDKRREPEKTAVVEEGEL
ncbi:hypothetical protein ACHAXT_011510 [Thalassiosira profunda]